MHRFYSVRSVMNSLHSIFRLLCKQLTLGNSLANPNCVYTPRHIYSTTDRDE